MEKSFYQDRYDVQLKDFAKTLKISTSELAAKLK